MNVFRCLFQRGMSAGELRVKLDQIHQSLHLAILHNRKLIMQELDTLNDKIDAQGVQLTAANDKADALIAALQTTKEELAALIAGGATAVSAADVQKLIDKIDVQTGATAEQIVQDDAALAP